MLKIENVEVVGWEAAIRGMRNPMNSWGKSDSFFCESPECCFCDDECNAGCEGYGQGFNVGEADFKLMTTLRNAGTDHRKFMRMITVYMDITAPLYWWKEFDTYKVGTVANSCSTMHKIAAKEFAVNDFSHEHLDGASRDMFVQNDHNQPYFFCSFEDMLYIQVEALNRARNLYLETKDKKYWWQMIQLLPSSYNQRRTVMLNYEVLTNIYKSRKNHKLDEWCVHDTPKEHDFRNKEFSSGMWGFCDWIENLPYSELITGGKSNV